MQTVSDRNFVYLRHRRRCRGFIKVYDWVCARHSLNKTEKKEEEEEERKTTQTVIIEIAAASLSRENSRSHPEQTQTIRLDGV